MSDENELASAPAEAKDEGVNLDASEIKEVAATETEGKEGETKEAGETAGEVEPKKPSGAQRAKAREARLLGELQAREREIEELRRNQPAKAGEAKEAKEPVEADFNGDFFAFQQAATAFKAGKAARDAIREEFETRKQSEHSTKQAEIVRERDLAHAERVESAREIITDFDKTMEGMKGYNVRNEVIEEIKSSENSAAIAYHLAKNPDLLSAMDRMSARELAREMGRLEATVKLPEGKKHTTAPAPLVPLKGGASGSFDPAKASMDEYVAKRQAGWKG